MPNNIYYVNEKWYEKAARKVKEKAVGAFYWGVDHRVEIAAVTSGVIALVGATSTVVRCVKPSAVTLHDRRVVRTYYDPSTGMHWDLRRKSTNADRIQLMERRRNGERIEDILKSLRLI